MKSFPSKFISENRKSKTCPFDILRAGTELSRRIENLKWVEIVTIALTFAFSGVEALAQPQSKVAKIGWLGARSASAPAREVFERELRALGYAQGKNIAFEYRYAEGKLDRLPALVDELVHLNVDVLVTPSTPAAVAGKNATRTIPIVFYSGSDPVAAGLVDSLARPGGNITGFTTMSAVLAGKRLELLKETVPKLARVAALWNPQDPISAQSWKESQLPAREMGLQLQIGLNIPQSVLYRADKVIR